jgi:hypothetical protein
LVVVVAPAPTQLTLVMVCLLVVALLVGVVARREFVILTHLILADIRQIVVLLVLPQRLLTLEVAGAGNVMTLRVLLFILIHLAVAQMARLFLLLHHPISVVPAQLVLSQARVRGIGHVIILL